jgi:hypothetical protein
MKKRMLNEEILRLRKMMGLNENFEAPSNENNKFELNGRPVDVSDMDIVGPTSPDGESSVENLFYFDSNEELTPEESKEFKRKYKNYFNDMLGQRGDDIMASRLGEVKKDDPEEKMVSFDDLLAQDTDGMSPGDQAMIDAHDEEEANKYASKNYDDVESGAIAEDWGGSDQGYMNKMIHDDLNQPTEFSFGMFDDLKGAAAEAVDHFWDEWEEYNTDREGLVMKAMKLYLRKYFPDWYENVSKMFS